VGSDPLSLARFVAYNNDSTFASHPVYEEIAQRLAKLSKKWQNARTVRTIQTIVLVKKPPFPAYATQSPAPESGHDEIH
jgi:hypothetical protein